MHMNHWSFQKHAQCSFVHFALGLQYLWKNEEKTIIIKNMKQSDNKDQINQTEDIKGEKGTLRKALLRRIPISSSPEFEAFQRIRTEISRKICEQLFSCPEWQDAATVFCYVGTERELDTCGILHAALCEGKQLAVPKTEGKGEMSAREVRGLNELLPGAMGILEPAEDAPVIPKEKISLIIVPGLAFDSAGYRLGYGGGYYDRYLSDFLCCSIGLCPEARLLKQVPRESHDHAVQMLITESRIIRKC